MHACVRTCVRACVRACVVRAHACVRACVRARACVCARASPWWGKDEMRVNRDKTRVTDSLISINGEFYRLIIF